ncbi:MAG: phosphate ABC transporter substrate-binding protein PstS [Candidatus Bathyarchaeia archaeon]|jgi:phosphate ABC transporter phosphate-binding protein
MKNTYIIIAAIVVIVIIIGGVFAYIYLSTPAKKSTSTLAAATVNGAGGTLVYPLMTVWQGAYGSAEPQITVNYNPVGSGTGITDFTKQLVDFGESDAPMTATQYAALPSGTTALTIPISASAVVPAYNLKLANGTVCQDGLKFTGAVLADIFLGTITKWNDPKITALNPTIPLPNTLITTVHRSDGSGTMFAFTNFLYDSSSTWASQVGKPSTSPAWPTAPAQIAAPKNAGVAAAISETNGAIGPLEIAYILENTGQSSLYYGTVQNAAGNYILASVTNIAAALQAGAAVGLPAGNAAWTSVSIVNNIFNDTAATTAYPIVTMTYALVYQEQNYNSRSYAESAATVNFLSWIVNSGQSLGKGLGYVPLPANIVTVDDATLKLITYNGTPIS